MKKLVSVISSKELAINVGMKLDTVLNSLFYYILLAIIGLLFQLPVFNVLSVQCRVWVSEVILGWSEWCVLASHLWLGCPPEHAMAARYTRDGHVTCFLKPMSSAFRHIWATESEPECNPN